MAQGPITVVTSGTNIQNPSLSGTILNSTQPFTKLDTQNIVSFQTISILFNDEPTQAPASGTYYAITQIYQFPHGYSYIPSTWMTWQNGSPENPGNPTSGNSATTFYGFGDDSSGQIAYNTIINGPTGSADDGSVGYVTYNSSGSLAEVTGAYFYTTTDITNVYLNVMKVTYGTISGSAIPIYLAGITLNCRVYVFTEPAGTSTY